MYDEERVVTEPCGCRVDSYTGMVLEWCGECRKNVERKSASQRRSRESRMSFRYDPIRAIARALEELDDVIDELILERDSLRERCQELNEQVSRLQSDVETLRGALIRRA